MKTLKCMFQAGSPFYTTAPSCCVPASHCHLSATLQNMSNTVESYKTMEMWFDFLSHF